MQWVIATINTMTAYTHLPQKNGSSKIPIAWPPMLPVA